MKHNVFKFGDIYYRQKDSTVIGSAPVSNWATIVFNFYENTIIEPTFRANLRLDTPFVDNKIGFWRLLQHNDYNTFTTTINEMHKLD